MSKARAFESQRVYKCGTAQFVLTYTLAVMLNNSNNPQIPVQSDAFPHIIGPKIQHIFFFLTPSQKPCVEATVC